MNSPVLGDIWEWSGTSPRVVLVVGEPQIDRDFDDAYVMPCVTLGTGVQLDMYWSAHMPDKWRRLA